MHLHDYEDDIWGALDIALLSGAPIDRIKVCLAAWMNDYEENTKALPEMQEIALQPGPCVCAMCRQQEVDEALR